MTPEDEAYLEILQSGLAAIRNSATAGDIEHCRAEAEHLHEIPGLVGERRVERHRCYISQHRAAYLEWANKSNRRVVDELIHFFYARAWRILESRFQPE
jgi:hypothetical protein